MPDPDRARRGETEEEPSEQPPEALGQEPRGEDEEVVVEPQAPPGFRVRTLHPEELDESGGH